MEWVAGIDRARSPSSPHWMVARSSRAALAELQPQTEKDEASTWFGARNAKLDCTMLRRNDTRDHLKNDRDRRSSESQYQSLEKFPMIEMRAITGNTYFHVEKVQKGKSTARCGNYYFVAFDSDWVMEIDP